MFTQKTVNFHTKNIEKSPKSSASPGAELAELLRSRPPRGATSKDSDFRVNTMPWLLRHLSSPHYTLYITRYDMGDTIDVYIVYIYHKS